MDTLWLWVNACGFVSSSEVAKEVCQAAGCHSAPNCRLQCSRAAMRCQAMGGGDVDVR